MDDSSVPVIQADRNAAADWFYEPEDDLICGPFCAMIRDGRDDKQSLVQAFARHRLAQSAADRAALEAARTVRDEAVRALEVIRSHTNADDETSYRADDREGCLDAVFAQADNSLQYIALAERAAREALALSARAGEQ